MGQGESVIIFDEVQKFPQARQAVKYLVKDGRFQYIETGSLISIKKTSKEIVIPSEEDKRKMYPMDFEEFLWARGYELFFHEYYYTPEGNKKEQKYEVDFLIVKDRHLCPIEVKSSSYKNHESFDYFVKKYKPKQQERFVIYTKDLCKEGDITRIPIYMTLCL